MYVDNGGLSFYAAFFGLFTGWFDEIIIYTVKILNIRIPE